MILITLNLLVARLSYICGLRTGFFFLVCFFEVGGNCVQTCKLTYSYYAVTVHTWLGAEHQHTGKISNMNKEGGNFGGHIRSTIWQPSYY